jgi:hypothetical protein
MTIKKLPKFDSGVLKTSDGSVIEMPLNHKIYKILTSVSALTFCMKEMLLCEEIQNDEIKESLDQCLPRLVDQTQKYVYNLLKEPQYGRFKAYDLWIAYSCSWPAHLTANLLMNFGVTKEDMPVANIQKKLGNTNAQHFFESLTFLHETLYDTILTKYNYSRDELSPETIVNAVLIAHDNKDFTKRSHSFGDWFPEAVLMAKSTAHSANLDSLQPN